MKTKEEVIKEAWDNSKGLNTEIWADYWSYEKAKEQGLNEDGFILVRGYEPERGESVEVLRPPQLRGIENNNGWVKIESEDDLPKDGDYWVALLSGEITTLPKDTELFSDNNYWLLNVSHYQPITKPKKPIY